MVTRGKAEVDLAYAAGIIDGEGSISIRKIRPSGRQQTPAYTATVDVGSTSEYLIDWLTVTFGGSAYHQQPTQSHYLPVRRWNVASEQAADFCRLVLPYLKIKRSQAALLIEFQERRVGRRGVVIDEMELAKREHYRLVMQGYNGHPQRLSETAPDAGEAIV